LVARASALPGHEPALIARSAYYVGLDGGRVIWVSDAKADAAGSGPPVEPQIVMAGLDGRDLVSVSRLADQHPTVRNYGHPAAGGGPVAWWEDETNLEGTALVTLFVVWSATSGKASILPTPGSGVAESCAGNWLVWIEDSDVPSPVVRGLPMGALSAP
jgi:hypothetical protein